VRLIVVVHQQEMVESVARHFADVLGIAVVPERRVSDRRSSTRRAGLWFTCAEPWVRPEHQVRRRRDADWGGEDRRRGERRSHSLEGPPGRARPLALCTFLALHFMYRHSFTQLRRADTSM